MGVYPKEANYIRLGWATLQCHLPPIAADPIGQRHFYKGGGEGIFTEFDWLRRVQGIVWKFVPLWKAGEELNVITRDYCRYL